MIPVRKLSVIALLMSFFSVTTGCAAITTYCRDRAMDLVDVVNFDVGIGLGIDAHVAATDAIAFGVGFSDTTRFGLRDRRLGSWRDTHAGIPVATIFGLFYEPAGPAYSRFTKDALVTSFATFGDRRDLQGRRYGSYVSESLLIFNVRLIRGTDRTGLFVETQMLGDIVRALDVEVSATAGIVGFRFGFSPGQLADFLLGLLTIDIAGDDTNSWDIPSR